MDGVWSSIATNRPRLEVLDVCGVSEEPFAQFEEVSEIPARQTGNGKNMAGMWSCMPSENETQLTCKPHDGTLYYMMVRVCQKSMA
jgi:hypothetical protein